MIFRNVTKFAVMLGVVVSMLSGAGHAQTASQIVGTWQVVSISNVAADGSKSNPFGTHPLGLIIFSADGHFSQLLSRNDLPRFASNNRAQGTAEENKAVVQGSIAIAGTYSIRNKVLILKTVVSSYPNWGGTDQERKLAAFSHDAMTWTLAGSVGGQTESVWKRLK